MVTGIPPPAVTPSRIGQGHGPSGTCRLTVQPAVTIVRRPIIPGQGAIRVRIVARPGTQLILDLTLTRTILHRMAIKGQPGRFRSVPRIITLYRGRAYATTALQTNRRAGRVRGQVATEVRVGRVGYVPPRPLSVVLTLVTRVPGMPCATHRNTFVVLLARPH